MSSPALDSPAATETLEIENGLSLIPRIKLLLTLHRTSLSSVAKPIDEWQLKTSIIHFLKTSLSIPVTVPEEDLKIRRFKDLKKRKRDDPVAHGALFIRDLGFFRTKLNEKDWRSHIVEKMNGIELNLEGVKFILSVEVPKNEDFDGLKKEWEDFYAFGRHSRGGRQQPDTIVLRGAPSRWFSEPRVSSKPSMLVTHTIFSTFGKIRNLHVAEDDDVDTNADEDGGDLVSGLQCKIVVRFEKYTDFYNALKVFCGRSLQKQGSRLRADYEVTWDKDGFFRNSSDDNTQERSSRNPTVSTGQYRSEAPRRQPQMVRFSSENDRSKRFKE